VSNLNSTTSKYMWDAAITVSTPPPAMPAPAVSEPLPPPPPPPAPQQPSSL
jgi:hypothetical protein